MELLSLLVGPGCSTDTHPDSQLYVHLLYKLTREDSELKCVCMYVVINNIMYVASLHAGMSLCQLENVLNVVQSVPTVV